MQLFKVASCKLKLVYGLIGQMLSNKTHLVFLNNDVEQSEAKCELLLKTNGFEEWIRMMRVLTAFVVSFLKLSVTCQVK